LPRDLGPNRELILFLQRSGQQDEADRLLEKLSADQAPDLSRWARRHFATTLVGRPNGYDLRRKALGLVEQNLRSSPKDPDPEDVKARAVVQTIDPDTRKEAERKLKEFADRGDLTPDEYYLLARLYFDSGRVIESVEYFAIAARPRPGVTPEHLAGLMGLSKSPAAHRWLAVFLINQKRTGEAIELARKYESGCPVVLTARLLSGAIRSKSPGPEFERQVEEWLAARMKEYEGKPELAALAGARAESLDARGRYDEAIDEYRRALKLEASDLAANNLSMLIALQQPTRVREAIDLMNRVIGVRGPAPAYL